LAVRNNLIPSQLAIYYGADRIRGWPGMKKLLLDQRLIRVLDQQVEDAKDAKATPMTSDKIKDRRRGFEQPWL